MNNSSTTSSVSGHFLSLSPTKANAASAKSSQETASFNETLSGMRKDVMQAKSDLRARTAADNRARTVAAHDSAKRQAEHARMQESRNQAARDTAAAKKSGAGVRDTKVDAGSAAGNPPAKGHVKGEEKASDLYADTAKHAEGEATDELVETTDGFPLLHEIPPVDVDETVAAAMNVPTAAPVPAFAAKAVTAPGSGTAGIAGSDAALGVDAEKTAEAAKLAQESELTSTKAGDAGTKESFAKMLAGSGLLNQDKLSEAESKSDLRTSLNSPATPTFESIARAAELLPTAGRGFVVQTGVGPSVGHPQWSQAVGDRVLWLAAQNITSAELRLDPPELGPMQVRISVHQDQVQVNFTSAHAGVREALDQGAARLREMFNEQGMNLNVNVSDQSAQRREDGEGSSGRRQSGEADGTEESVIAETAIANLRLVDSYA